MSYIRLLSRPPVRASSREKTFSFQPGEILYFSGLEDGRVSTCGTGVHSPLVVLRHPPRMSIYNECARGRENISCIMPSQQWKPCVVLVVFSLSILYTTAWASQHRCSLVAEGSTKIEVSRSLAHHVFFPSQSLPSPAAVDRNSLPQEETFPRSWTHDATATV